MEESLEMDRRSQFFVISSVVILLNLVAMSQYIMRSTFPVSERPIDEFSFSRDLTSVIGDVSASAPPYLLKRDIWALDTHLRSATGWKFESSLCCGDVCECSSLNLASFTAPGGQSAAIKVSSDKAAISSSLAIGASS